MTSFASDVLNHPFRPIPKDCSVHEVTSSTLLQLKLLLETRDACSFIDSTLQAATSRSDRLTARGIADKVVTALISNLEGKAKEYKEKRRSQCFLLNNMRFIDRAISNGALAGAVGSATVEGASASVRDLRMNVTKDQWSKAVFHLMSLPEINIGAGQLKHSDKKNIKAAFAGFNNEVDDLVA